ncbi:YciI family protein [Cellulomonas dongxiuzhuiae]|uniref:YCII-related domain-containing protein n=1 Tax=Cellulomonas dongxiuzhuiae TaxID=2819979 RepID=A0ABX8GLC6_9CELL|nr:YciI family protein [Cellulomonas dongxiuzhuiae]MBO3095336.1 hypothetical protein [Cellulomonas dongxiuzhuiae]QWC16326.1 hypothetical protein KKR89_01190 [Cellulomonas dongxiuzhuiae]
MTTPTTTPPATWMLLLWGDPDACVDLEAAYDAHGAFAAACAAQGHEIVGGEELASPSQARLLHVRADSPEVTDGPYAETTEQLGGFYLVRTSDPDGLLRLAAPLVMDDGGTLELRPVAVHADAPAGDPERVAASVA